MVRTYQDPQVQATSSAAEVSITAMRKAKSPLVLWFLLIVALAGFYGWCVLRGYYAYRLSWKRDQLSLQRAIQLQPRDPANYDLLGQYLMWKAQDPQAAAYQFQQAVRLNPYASSYWLHLARAENSLGNDTEETRAIGSAIAVDPTTPAVAWEAANFFLVQGRTEDALDQLAVVVRNDHAMAETALDTSWRALGDVQPIVQRLPPNPEIYLAFIKLLVGRQQWGAADQVWSSMLRLNREFDPRAALFYVDALLAARDVTGAQRAWRQLIDGSTVLKPYVTPDNQVVNSSFEHDILNSAFDWHYVALPGVSGMLDSTQTHRGNESLLITYSGTVDDAGIWQYVPVTPGATYVASAWVRSGELESANGPRLAIQDGYKNVEYGHSEETVGTTNWHYVEATFTAPQDVTLVLVRFSRRPGGTQIRGQFWIDDVRVSTQGSAKPEL